MSDMERNLEQLNGQIVLVSELLSNKYFIQNVISYDGGGGYKLVLVDNYGNTKEYEVLNYANSRDGQDGGLPAIGLLLDDDGYYYWTLNGDWLLVNGERVRASGLNWRDGEDGQNDLTPQFKVEGGKWWVKLGDDGEWQYAGNAVAGLTSLIVAIDVPSQDNVKFILADGSTFTIPRVLPYSSESSVGNSTILCAKEHTFNDGTPPIYEWFLLGEPVTNKLYYSRSLTDRVYLTTFKGDIQYYSFGILPSGDIVVCKRAEYLHSGGNDNNRVNPYVFKFSERWSIQHEVDFGEGLKPCGWARNGGFRPLPDGTALMCEYTRITVATSNVWKIVGDPTNPKNWTVKKSFTLSGDRDRGFKHCHAVMFDHFTGVTYLSTGDDSTGAMVFASTDNGETWRMLRDPSERYCRLSMMTFTKDYIYWGQDSPAQHNFYRGERVDGVLDYATVVPWVVIPGDKDHYFSTYGQAYLPEFDAVFLLDRQDSPAPGQVLPIRVVNLTERTIETIGYVENTDPDGGYVGFRTIFSEWYPTGGRIHLGFGFDSPTMNKNKVCGNQWPIKRGANSVNNLCVCVWKESGRWSLRFETVYL